MIFGIDYLGGANYVRRILKKHPAGFAAGFILNTNKPHWPKTNCWGVVEKLAASGNCPLIRVHAMWEDNHQYNPRKHDKIILAELARANALAAKYPAVRFLFSPFCELSTRGASVNQLYTKLKAAARSVELVNSVYSGAIRSDVTNEVHGSHAAPKGPYVFSFDGTQCVDSDMEAFKSRHGRAEAFFFWTSHFNLKWAADGKKDPTKRNNRKTKPYPELWDSFVAYTEDTGGVSLSSQHIYKTHADQHGPKRAAREGKPVFISKVNAKKVEMVAGNGEVVATLVRTGNFTDGRPLYRLPMFGFQAAKRAKAACGSPIVTLRANGKEIGRVHPAFRAGSFR